MGNSKRETPPFCPFLGCEAPYDPSYPSHTSYPAIPLNVTGATSIQLKWIVGLKYKKMMPYDPKFFQLFILHSNTKFNIMIKSYGVGNLVNCCFNGC